MARKTLVAGNWKLNGDLTLAAKMLPQITQSLENKQNTLCAIFPSFVHLDAMNAMAEGSGISIGAQNVSEHQSGAFTGEVSLAMLSSIGIKHLLLGHSERRTLFSESDELIFNKTCLAVEQDFNVTFCVGETLDERQQQQTTEVVAKQLQQLLSKPELLANITIAYEPVWAIGTGQTATPEQAQQVHHFIRAEVAKVSETIADTMHILYGGSVNAKNAQALFTQPDIDGGLVGGASLNIEEFLGVLACTN